MLVRISAGPHAVNEALLDASHDSERHSWVPGADGHPEFPIQNLPLCVFTPAREEPRGGIAIGDFILDLRALAVSGVLAGEAQHAVLLAARSTLNAWMALPAPARRAFRLAISDWLSRERSGLAVKPPLFWPAADCLLQLPAIIGDYTDFYAGIHHAENVGRLFRPDAPLLPNYKYVPVGYHGRSSSVDVSPSLVKRPCGQIKQDNGPDYRPSAQLDFEVELGLWLRGGNAAGEVIPIEAAREAIVGITLLNDWSARDIQAWEYQPLGPFLAKNFATTVSPWLVTMEALAPFRIAQAPRPPGDPKPLPYLWSAMDQATGALDIAIDVSLSTNISRDARQGADKIARCSARELYWTPAQLVAHHASNGCRLKAGDLLGTGTISGSDDLSLGSLLERTRAGRMPLTLSDGEVRRFLDDGDEVTFTAHCHREGFVSIGFGSCVGRVCD